MNGQRALRRLVGSAVVLALVAGCGATGGDKAGGVEPVAPHHLNLVNVDSDSTLVESFATAVRSLSNGTLAIDVHNDWHAKDPQQEADTVTDVVAGRADLGISPTRSFDTIGIDTFQALQAPFLIDTYALQQKVLSSTIPAQMLGGLGASGLVGLAIAPGPMRRLLGRSRALVTLADLRGATIAVRPSDVTKATFEALGATPVVNVAGDPISTFDGIESHLEAIAGNSYDGGAVALTTNVDLWPRMTTVFANGKAFAGLSAEEQGWLREAASQAVAGEMTSVLDSESAQAAILCRRNLRDVSATAADLVDLRRAVEPVYTELDATAPTKSFIDQIEGMQASSTAPDAPSRCPQAESSPTPSASPGPPTQIDGTWEATITQAEFMAAKPTPEPNEIDPGNWGLFVIDLHAGLWFVGQGGTPADRCSGCAGTFVVTGNHVTLQSNAGDEFEAAWSIFKDQLTFFNIAGQALPTGWRVKPLKRIGQ